MNNEELIDRTIAYLNELLEIDPDAIERLCETSVQCNQALGHHPTVQMSDDDPEIYRVGMLGILNGLLGVNSEGRGHVTAVFDDNGELIKFERTTTS